jgi:hypothetical protein
MIIFSKMKDMWKNYDFEIILIACISFIAVCGFVYWLKGCKGTWNNTYQYSEQPKKSNKRAPPKESKGEIECKRVLESIFSRPFPKDRPDFLKNPVTGGNFNLELDCFNKEMRLAVEYSGAQHYKYIPYFHRTKDAFTNQKYRDEMKRSKCKENGITLIEVPYTVKIEDIESFLRRELRNKGYHI